MRITTNMIRRNYQTNLNSSLNGVDFSRYQVETGRKFEHSYQDPSAAATGSVLENRFARNSDYIEATKNTMNWQNTQEDVLMQVEDIAAEVNKKYSVEAASDTNAENRDIYAEQLREMQKSMVNILNVKYGNTYVMAGNDATNPPFELTEGGSLLYRGINVDSDPDALIDPADPTSQTIGEVLDELANEAAYIDLGFGMNIVGGEIVPSSAFNSAVPGIAAIGYGKTPDVTNPDGTVTPGTSKNLIVLMGQMADQLDSPSFNREAYEGLWDQFNTSTGLLLDEVTEIGTKSKLLDSTLTRLEAEEISIYEQFEQSINIDEAEAITNFSYANYVYNASLKVGNMILTPSLLDFLQ